MYPPATQAAEAAPAVVPPVCPPGANLAVDKSAISVHEDPFQCSVIPTPAVGDGTYALNTIPSVEDPDPPRPSAAVLMSATSVQFVPSHDSHL